MFKNLIAKIKLKKAQKRCPTFKNKSDFQEVKHGEWVKTDDGEYRCTNCNEYICIDCDMHPIDDCDIYHCPLCGAKMDGAKNG